MSEVDQFANVEILVPKLVTTATSLERWDFKRMSGRSNISTNRSTNPERLVMISLIYSEIIGPKGDRKNN